jgi:hypothetical protein
MNVRRFATLTDGRQAAKSRHPCNGWRPDLSAVKQRMADQLRSEEHPWPDLAAALIAERGKVGLDRPAFAARLGIGEAALWDLEEGRPGTGPLTMLAAIEHLEARRREGAESAGDVLASLRPRAAADHPAGRGRA